MNALRRFRARRRIVAAALVWAGADGVPVGGRTYAALRSAVESYRRAS